MALKTSYETYAEALAAAQAVTNLPAFLLTITRRGGDVDRTFYTYERLKGTASDPSVAFSLPSNVDLWAQISGTWFRLRTTDPGVDEDATTVDFSILDHAPDGNFGAGDLASASLDGAISQGEIAGAGKPFLVTLFEAVDRDVYTIDSLANLVNEISIAGGNGTVAITSSSVANPSVITAAGHGLVDGDVATIAGHSGSTPSINGAHTVTVIDANTFTIPVNVTVGGTGGTLTYDGIETRVGETIPIRDGMAALVDISGELTGTITSISVANPTHVTCVGHNLVTGDSIVVSGSNSTPSINGTRAVTVLDADHFTVAVNVTVLGTAGTWAGTARWVKIVR